MSDIRLGEEEGLIQQNAVELSQEIAKRASEIDRNRLFPRENLELLAKHGYLGLVLPKPYGLGASTLSFVLTTEALAKACASTAWVYVVHTATSYGLYASANEAQREGYLAKLADGTNLAAFAATEPSTGASFTAVEMSAELHENEYIINGTKSFITAAGEADVYLVLLRTSKEPASKNLAVLIVEKGAPGFSPGGHFEGMGMRGVSWGELIFRDCRIHKDNIITDAFRVINAEGFVGMLGASAISLGLAQAAFDIALNHAKQRVAAGQPLTAREGIQFMLAEMATDVRAMRQMVYFGAERRDRSPDPYRELLEVKVFTSETAIGVVEKAMRITGAHGYSRELSLERHYRDIRAPMLHFQTLETGKRALGRILTT